MRIDARIPVVFAPITPHPADYVLSEGTDFTPPDLVAAPHDTSCLCCAGGRNPVASLLGGLFFARARGTVPFFRRVVVHARTDAGRTAVALALADDPVASGCFRPG